MPTSTVNAEKKTPSDIIEQINSSMGFHDSKIILKDGRCITGRIVKTTADNNQGSTKPERTVTIHHDIGMFDLDLLNISRVIPGHLK